MRPVQLILILLFGGLTMFLEFRSIKESIISWGDLFDAIPLFVLFILTIAYLFVNSGQYRQHKNLRSFIPSAVGLLLLGVTAGHMWLRSHYDNSPTLFTATNYELGNDGGFSLEFKKNNHLKGKKIDHFSSTTYWGTYKKQSDTLILNIPLDFKMGRQAIFQDSILRFIDDTVKFEISGQ
jgi:hypothetical protein